MLGSKLIHVSEKIQVITKQYVSPSLKPIGQKDLWNFWFDKSLKFVMGHPCLVDDIEQIFFMGPQDLYR